MATFLWLTWCGQCQIVINEVHYDPDIKTELVEFIELHNANPVPVELGDWRLTRAVEFTFPPGTVLDAGGYLVVAGNPNAVTAKFGGATLGPWSGQLANEGEIIELRDSSGQVVDTVDYQLGFPWPTVGDPPGYSIELVHPALDNSVGGHWRASVAGNPAQQNIELVPADSTWRYLKGTGDPSSPTTLWRTSAFDDAPWDIGAAPFGYDPAIVFGTRFDDMRDNYTSFFLRRNFTVDDPADFSSLNLEVLFDDGFRMWINGTQVLSVGMPAGEVAYSATATGSARESNDYDTYALNNPASYLQAGDNLIAVQVHNIHLNNSSDCFFDARLTGLVGPSGRGPTPGARNSVYSQTAPPAIRQVEPNPAAPAPGQPVAITAKVTDPDGVGMVTLSYQLVDPGNYIELTSQAYTNSASWTSMPMRDDATSGDALAGDSVYTAVLPGSLQIHRRLVRYRISTTDSGGQSVAVPYPDDPVPNFAYFVYAGVPAWTGAVRPGDPGTLGQPFTVDSNEMNRLPAIHLIGLRTTVEQATWFSRYTGDAYRWLGTLVYDGKVYDHVRYRARGGVWRYAMAKNMWKFGFNRGHDLEMRDNWGRKYSAPWTKLNLGASIQQGDYNHRGEQGMFESLGFRLFNLAGVPSPRTTFIQFRVIDDLVEVAPTSQYDGDFWGVYLVVEQQDGRFLDEHGLPDGNLYKMEGGSGELNNLGPAGPDNKSDLNAFLGVVNNSSQATSVPDSWWRTNVNLASYYSYQTIVQGIHHYDICYDKNFFYYRYPTDGRWEVLPWDLDLIWAENMYDAGCGGIDRFKRGLLPNALLRPEMHKEWRNRIREIRDLLFNEDEAWRLIDEYGGRLRGPDGAPSILDADRSQWDYNPRMVDGTYSSALSKAGQGRFYRWPNEPFASKDFAGCLEVLKRYVLFRGANSAANPLALDEIAADPDIPATPNLSYIGSAGFPANRISLRSSDYSGTAAFASMKWRIGEITVPTAPSWAADEPWHYEINAVWESAELSTFNRDVTVPPGVLKPDHSYRARVRWTDQTGRTSHWSPPVQFVAGAPDNAAALVDHLRLSELMLAPTAGPDFEFIELLNTSTSLTLDLAGAKFTSGIDYTFPSGAVLAPGAQALVIRATDPNAFRAHYGLDAGLPIFGPYTGALDNAGETLELKTAPAGAEIVRFDYNDGQGWPIPAFGSGHSLVPLDRARPGQASGSLDYPGNWRLSTTLNGSPGQSDPPPPPSDLVLNELAAHTDYSNPQQPDYDSNDWIELHNRGPDAVSLAGYYLSDNRAHLTKWAIPAQTLGPGDYVVFDEVSGFHNPITAGFGLDKAGEQVLLSYLPGNGSDRVVDFLQFKGQENDLALGRHPDGHGAFRYPLPRTPGTTNAAPSSGPVISELLYHPTDPNPIDDNTWDEFIEVHNPTTSTVLLNDSSGSWRLDGGVSFTFPAGIAIPPGGVVLVAGIDPTDPIALADFRAAHGLTDPSIRILGPYTGKLSNRSDRIALEKPQAPDLSGESYSWVVVDEVIYGNQDPWPLSANGGGYSLHRLDPASSGNEPSNWLAAAPTPGQHGEVDPDADFDQDGMPDVWERQFNLDPSDPDDAAVDSDFDGLTNLEEYLSGTNPRDDSSTLRVETVIHEAADVILMLQVVAGRTYTIEHTATLNPIAWQRLADLPTQSFTGVVEVRDSVPPTTPTRHYRVVTPRQP